MTVYSKLPIVGSKELKDKVKMFTEAKEKFDSMQEIFTYFLTVQWIYENNLSDKIWKLMSLSDR